MNTNKTECLTNESVGLKHDSEKPSISLIPRQAIEQEALVMMFGAKKYGKNNWRQGLAYSRLIDAALRHILAYADGEDLDPETGLPHLAHARCCMAMLMGMPGAWDDRHHKSKPRSDPTNVETFGPLENPSCLDSAYERRAIEQGHSIKDPFPENRR